MLQGIKNLYHLFVAFCATLFFRSPAKNLIVIGVTGTDGKTTTVNLIYEILKTAGKPVSMISSVGAKISGQDYDLPFHVTTPSSWQLQRFLRMIKDMEDKKDKKDKEKYLVLEVTSHALDQNRVWGIPFKVGVLTNITHEHLDYHKTFEKYVKAKMKLFKRVKWAVVSKDFLDKGFKVSGSKGLKVISYGLKTGDLTPQKFSFQTLLPGDYNKLNCLAGIAAAKALEVDDETIREGIEGFVGVEGRFEFIKTNGDFRVVIDFAHTPNALENLLKTVRPMVKGKLIHVFGSAGLRDASKRPVMGEVAAKYDDVMILTEEDYRTEDVNQIMEEIKSGIDSGQARMTGRILKQVQNDMRSEIFKIPDRQEAINKAIKMAKKGDWVVLTGKGHERSLCRGKTEHPWSEKEAVERAIRLV